MNKKSHWENVYQTKDETQVSWFREHLDNSLQMILQTNVGKDATIIDVGGGSSTLVDDLLQHGFADVSVLDISVKALENSKERLGQKAQLIEWIEGDITEASLPKNHYDVWHDRAVFHFLTDREDRRKYVELVKKSLKSRRTYYHCFVWFETDPKKCSGLDIVQYSPDSMHDEFGNNFELIKSFSETHETPFQTTQEFIYCYCRLRVGS